MYRGSVKGNGCTGCIISLFNIGGIAVKLELYKKKLIQVSILLKEKIVSKSDCIKSKVKIRYKKYKNKINEYFNENIIGC